MIPLSWSLDHVGPIARSVSDAAIVLQAIAGYDALDIASANVPVEDYVSGLPNETKRLRVGIPREYFFDDLNEEISAAVESAIATIRTLVAEVREVRLPDSKIDIPADRVVQLAESHAYHAENIARTPELYQPETLRRIRLGENISAAEYMVRRRELDEARRQAHEIFADIVVLITPTSPIPAPAIADLKKDPEALRPAELELLRNTRPFNVWGLPTISIPCGVTKAGLPIGLQIAAPPWREDLALKLAYAYENLICR